MDTNSTLTDFEQAKIKNMKSGESYTDQNGLTHYVLDTNNMPDLTDSEKNLKTTTGTITPKSGKAFR